MVKNLPYYIKCLDQLTNSQTEQKIVHCLLLVFTLIHFIEAKYWLPCSFIMYANHSVMTRKLLCKTIWFTSSVYHNQVNSISSLLAPFVEFDFEIYLLLYIIKLIFRNTYLFDIKTHPSIFNYILNVNVLWHIFFLYIYLDCSLWYEI